MGDAVQLGVGVISLFSSRGFIREGRELFSSWPGKLSLCKEDFESWRGTSWNADWISPWGGSLGEKLGGVFGPVTCKQVS